MAQTIHLRSRSPEVTRRIARSLAGALEPLPRGGLVIVLLGDLGAGKTVFAGGLAHGLGVAASTPVVSPTFTVARAYRGRVPVHHVDAYLVRRAVDLEAAGFEEMGGEGRVTVVEWGDRIADALPADRLEATLTPMADADAPAAPGDLAGPGLRRIEVRALGPSTDRMLARWRAALEADAALSACLEGDVGEGA